MKKRFLSRYQIILISSCVTLLDQITKLLVLQYIKEGEFLIILNNFLHLQLVRNSGAAFSFFQQSTFLLGLTSFFAATFIAIFIFTNYQIRLKKALGLALLLGGTIGNGIDRWRIGFVTDFINIVPLNFPIFNFADIAINLAIIFLLLDIKNK